MQIFYHIGDFMYHRHLRCLVCPKAVKLKSIFATQPVLGRKTVLDFHWEFSQSGKCINIAQSLSFSTFAFAKKVSVTDRCTHRSKDLSQTSVNLISVPQPRLIIFCLHSSTLITGKKNCNKNQLGD
jgi:hypothetical protein